eukprot:6392943-Prymnesium_polylepis.1
MGRAIIVAIVAAAVVPTAEALRLPLTRRAALGGSAGAALALNSAPAHAEPTLQAKVSNLDVRTLGQRNNGDAATHAPVLSGKPVGVDLVEISVSASRRDDAAHLFCKLRAFVFFVFVRTRAAGHCARRQRRVHLAQAIHSKGSTRLRQAARCEACKAKRTADPQGDRAPRDCLHTAARGQLWCLGASADEGRVDHPWSKSGTEHCWAVSPKKESLLRATGAGRAGGRARARARGHEPVQSYAVVNGDWTRGFLRLT